MSEWKVGLSQSALDDSAQMIQCLIDASNEVFSASEADFQEMKSKTWYQRLWSIVTFSKDNEKVMAHGVSNLAKLQEIVTKALLILSNESSEVAAVVEENSAAIERLTKNQVAVIKEIEKLKYGYDRQLNLGDLSESKLYIIINSLAKLATEVCGGEESKLYVRAVMKAAGFSSVDTSLELYDIENLTADEMALLYQILQEYLYVATNSFENDYEIFEYVSLSPKKRQKIQEKIQETVLVAGIEFLAEYYEADEFEYAWIDTTDVNFEEDTEATVYKGQLTV